MDALVHLQPDAATGCTLITTPPRGVLLAPAGLAQLVRAEGWALRAVAGQSAPGSGEVSARPPDGQPPQTFGSVPIIDAALHDAWCGWAWLLAEPRRPDLAHCAGCTLYVLNPAPERLSLAGPTAG